MGFLFVATGAPELAHADMQIESASNSASVIFDDAATPTLDIGGDAGGGTILTATVTTPSRMTIVFNVECSQASSSTSEIDFDIVLDSVAVSPTTSPSVLCSGDGDQVQLNNSKSVAQSAVVDVAPGTHDIEIDVRTNGFAAGDRYRIDEIQVTVIVTPRAEDRILATPRRERTLTANCGPHALLA